MPERIRESLSFGARTCCEPSRVPVSTLIALGPMIFIFSRFTRSPWAARTETAGWINSLALSPENARSSIHVEYVTDNVSQAVLIGSSIIQMNKLAKKGLVAAPCGRCRSKVVNSVSSFATGGEQPNRSAQT